MKNTLRERRSAVDLSQATLAEGVGVTRWPSNAIERERYDLSRELPFEFAACFDCTIEDPFDPELQKRVHSRDSSSYDHRS